MNAATRRSAAPSLRVLCVDDNRDLADSEAEMLRIVGFDVRACYDGRTALEIAGRFHPCVCLIDLHMPGMDGDELACRLREQARARPPALVAVTAMSNDTCRERIEEAGFDLHLVKPVDPYKLLDVVNVLYQTHCASPAIR